MTHTLCDNYLDIYRQPDDRLNDRNGSYIFYNDGPPASLTALARQTETEATHGRDRALPAKPCGRIPRLQRKERSSDINALNHTRLSKKPGEKAQVALINYDKIVKGSSETRMQFLVLLGIKAAIDVSKDAADNYWKNSRSVLKKLADLVGRRNLSEEKLTAFYLATLSLIVHEVILLSTTYQPDDPHAFQGRYIEETTEIVANNPKARTEFINIINKNIEDYNRFKRGELDQVAYVFRMASRFFEKGDLNAVQSVVLYYPGIKKGVRNSAKVFTEALAKGEC